MQTLVSTIIYTLLKSFPAQILRIRNITINGGYTNPFDVTPDKISPLTCSKSPLTKSSRRFHFSRLGDYHTLRNTKKRVNFLAKHESSMETFDMTSLLILPKAGGTGALY